MSRTHKHTLIVSLQKYCPCPCCRDILSKAVISTVAVVDNPPAQSFLFHMGNFLALRATADRLLICCCCFGYLDLYSIADYIIFFLFFIHTYIIVIINMI